MSTIIEQIEFWNAFTYRRCTIPLNQQGLVYVSGPNGSGKSTPWEVLQHLGFGTTSRGLKKKGIVCTVPHEDEEDPSFRGELIFHNTSGPHEGRWMIRQSQHPKKSLLVEVLREVQGEWSKKWHGGGCPSGSPEAQKLATQILGLQQNEFEGCVYLSQAATHTLIEGKPSEKMLYLAHLFGIDRYDEVHAILKDLLKGVDKDLVGIVGMEGQLETLRAQVEEYGDYDQMSSSKIQMAQARSHGEQKIREWIDKRVMAEKDIEKSERRAQLVEERAALGEVIGDSDGLAGRLKDMRGQRDQLRDQVKQCEERSRLTRQMMEALHGINRKEHQGIDEKISGLHEQRALLVTTVKALKQRAEIEADLARTPCDLDLEDIQEQIAFIEKDLAVNHQKHSDVLQKIKAQQDQAKPLRGSIEQFKSGKCPTCKQPMDVANTKRLLQEVEQEIASMEREAHGLVKKIEAPQRNLGELKSQLVMVKKVSQLKAQLAELPEGDLVEVKAQRAALKTALVEQVGIQEKLIEARSLEDQRAALPDHDESSVRAGLGEIEGKLPEIQEEHRRSVEAERIDRMLSALPKVDLHEATSLLRTAKEAHDELRPAVDQLNQEIAVLDARLETHALLSAQIREVEAEVAKVEALRQRQNVLKYAVAVVPRLKKRRLHMIVCAVRDVLPRYAGMMFSHEPNTSFVIDDDEGSGESMDLLARRMVKVRGRMEPVLIPVKGFSGGEKQRLSVALVFTLHSLLDPSKRPDLLVLDEVDKGLDDRGVASLMAMVVEVKNQYGTVIMTSHRPQISGSKFDRVWKVEKSNEASTFKLVA